MAAHPVLASTLYAAETYHISAIKSRRLSTLHPALDTALNGGLEHSQIHCITAEADSAGKELCYAFLTSHVLGNDNAEATVIDTTNSFDVRKLHGVVVAALRKAESAEHDALKVLRRVKVMRAFDVVGLTECVAELRHQLEPLPLTPQAADFPHLLLIDSLSHPFTPLLKSTPTTGHSLLVAFLNSLHHLTRTQNLCTLLWNTAIHYPNSTPADCPSIFSSCLLRPVLGRSFAYLVDTHMLLHRMPLNERNAREHYSGTWNGRGGGLVDVLEVVQDKYGSRVGRWAAFRINAAGSLENAG